MAKKILLAVFIVFLGINSYCVEQEYMPAGYIRDDTIHPYYVKLTNEYFQKVDSGKIDCDYRSYRKQVEEPLDKIIEQLKNGKKPSLKN